MPATPARPPHKAVRPTPYTRQSQSDKDSVSLKATSGTAESSTMAALSAASAAGASTPEHNVKGDKKKKYKSKKKTRSSDASIVHDLAQQNKRRSESPVKPPRPSSQPRTKSDDKPSAPATTSAHMAIDGDHGMNASFPADGPTATTFSSPINVERPTLSAPIIPPSQKRNQIAESSDAINASHVRSISPDKRKKNKKMREKNKAREELKAFLRAERERGQTNVADEPLAAVAADKSVVPAAAATSLPTQGSTDDLTRIKLENALEEQQRALEEEKKRRSNQELARVREEAKKREETQRELQKLRDEVERWKDEAEKERRLKVECEKAMENMVETLEKQIEDKSSHNQAQAVVIKDHEATKGALKEAVECGVCLMTVNDPHILSCGHMACKGCLMEWFRTPGAYQSVILDPITPETDLSHRVKLCHVCRAIILRRPARVFFVRQILEPLGLYEHKDVPLPSSQLDPWDKIFPIERESYKIYDEVDQVWRCPTCGGEIAEGSCTGCGIIFSDIDDDFDDDMDSESEVVGSVLGDGPIIGGVDLGQEADFNDDFDVVQRHRGGRRHLLVDDEAEDDLSEDDDGLSELSDGEHQLGRQRQRPAAAPASLHDRARADLHLAGIFEAIDGGAFEGHRRHRHAQWDHPEDEHSPAQSSDEEESDLGPPGSEDEYGGSFIDDGEAEEDGSGYGDVTMFSEEDDHEDEDEAFSEPEHDARSSRRGHRGGPPPRVRRVQSDDSEDDDEDSHDDADNIQPVLSRAGRRRNAPIVISDSE
ncbi:hypothetical protein I317_00475 [Kwoniella heveanensis CBS 569]|uniref:RING-type domain-containing protein n=1 Tax=Kwoniella heveanensis BCC8398 TaxID=1296120 RepID=A0A1B9GY64_9TREE|nr:hypothetical protein I316_02447 [Kwoniella heveanensis BCC8398]OCF45573.1 hypothetical protein I317_00475 [Kwoniella heveanensis CBS 569]